MDNNAKAERVKIGRVSVMNKLHNIWTTETYSTVKILEANLHAFN